MVRCQNPLVTVHQSQMTPTRPQEPGELPLERGVRHERCARSRGERDPPPPRRFWSSKADGAVAARLNARSAPQLRGHKWPWARCGVWQVEVDQKDSEQVLPSHACIVQFAVKVLSTVWCAPAGVSELHRAHTCFRARLAHPVRYTHARAGARTLHRTQSMAHAPSELHVWQCRDPEQQACRHRREQAAPAPGVCRTQKTSTPKIR